MGLVTVTSLRVSPRLLSFPHRLQVLAEQLHSWLQSEGLAFQAVTPSVILCASEGRARWSFCPACSTRSFTLRALGVLW